MPEILSGTTIDASPFGAPVAMMIAGTALVTIRCLDIVLLFNALGCTVFQQ
ncbi:MAG: hypothetical protein HNEKOMLI_00356 [Sodalis sp. Psp]|nr:hypothetical protein [Sodalis sp. Psp]MCR3756842.1 hypothetical protein [Sodalis sp. Ppy]